MLKYKRVVFVCESGNCKSLLAAAIFNRDIPDKSIQAEARGLVVLFPEPGNAKAVAIAKSQGIDLENFRSRQLENDDFGDDVLALVMSEKMKAAIYNDYKSAVNVYTMKEFTEEAGDIGDPYGGELQEYGEFFENLEENIKKVIDKILKEEVAQ